MGALQVEADARSWHRHPNAAHKKPLSAVHNGAWDHGGWM